MVSSFVSVLGTLRLQCFCCIMLSALIYMYSPTLLVSFAKVACCLQEKKRTTCDVQLYINIHVQHNIEPKLHMFSGYFRRSLWMFKSLQTRL